MLYFLITIVPFFLASIIIVKKHQKRNCYLHNMKKADKKEVAYIKKEPLKLNMTFEQAMKKALNTPLPSKKAKKKP